MITRIEISPVYEVLTFHTEGNFSGPSFLLLVFDEQRIAHISVEELLPIRTISKITIVECYLIMVRQLLNKPSITNL